MKEELFEIKLDETGKRLLMRVSFWAKFLYVCTLLTCVFDLTMAYLGLKSLLKYDYYNFAYQKFYISFNIIFLIIYAILLPLQAYFFFTFSRKTRKAIQYEDSIGFNNSFKWLLKHVITASILFTLNSIWALVTSIHDLSVLNQ